MSKAVISLLFILLVACTPENVNCCYQHNSGLYVELRNDSTDQDRFTSDNTVYRIGKEFIFEYWIERNSKKLLFEIPDGSPSDNFDYEWDFVEPDSTNRLIISTVSMAIVPGVDNEFQTKVFYNMKRSNGSNYPFFSISGLVENEMNVWLHPFRDRYFRILELNPFPYIKYPYQIGNTWEWSLKIGSGWGDPRWCSWNGRITNNYHYEITDQETIESKVGLVDCWVIEASATSEIGATGLVAYYNPQLGFIKMDFINIDKSKVHLELVSVKEPGD